VGRIEFTADAIKAFAAAYDPQPQHLDECAAKATPLQGLAASGWQACAAVIRRVEQHFESASLRLGIASVEEIRWLRPVRPGDSLEIRVSWQQACTCPDCMNAELRAIVIEAVDQSHVPVLRMHGAATLACRAASPADLRGRCAQRPLRMSRVRRRPGGRLVRYFEDVELGDEIALHPYDFTPGALHTYACIIDGAFGGSRRSQDAVVAAPGACGWHVVAAWMRRIVDYYHAEADWLATRGHPVPLLGPAAGARCLTWFKPVRAGDRITFSSWAEHKVKAGTSREWGLLVAGAEGRHQNGELVVSLYPQFLLQKRPA
jgi:acyl dehydratase